MRFAILGMIIFAAVPAGAAVTGSVEGTVTDAQTGQPMAGVQVDVEGTTTTTDGQGEFLLDAVPVGAHNVVFRDASGNTVTQSADVSIDAPERLDVAVTFGPPEEVRIVEKAFAPPVNRPILQRGIRTSVDPLPTTDQLIESNRAAEVSLMATVDAEGRVADAQVLKMPRDLGRIDAIAAARAKQLRFSPAVDAEGKPTVSHAVVKVQWQPHWSRLMDETWGTRPCQGEGPMNLNLPNPTYMICNHS